MAEQPLSQRMRDAADVIDAANTRYSYNIFAKWSACELRNKALHVEAEESDDTEREARTEELARELYQGAWTAGRYVTRDHTRIIAMYLIDAGWSES